MLKPPACVTNDAIEQWTEFNWKLLDLLTNPAVAIALVVAVGVFIVINGKHKRFRRWITKISLGLIALIIALPLVGSYGLPLAIPADSGETADAIVVFGRGQDLRESRKDEALTLFEAGRAPLIFVSGKSDAPAIVETLEADGLATSQLEGEACSRTTAENGKYTAQVLMPKNIKRVILVTDPPHMLRSSLVLRSVGFEVIHHLSPFPESFSWYRSQVFAARESISFATYALSGRFHMSRRG